MDAFDFFFSFYGLVLGLSVTVIATGAARAFKHRRKVRIGWKTPMLAAFVALDIATFWDAAWTNFRHLPFSYGLLVAGLVVAVVYFIAASLIFPEWEDEVAGLDDHFWANKRAVLLLLVLANILLMIAAFWANLDRTNGMALMQIYAVNLGLYLALILTAALTRRAWLFAVTVGLHIAIYLLIAAQSVQTAAAREARLKPQAPPAAAAPAHP
ncbi:MAG: hypothetical protein ACT6RD_11165 [Brevundimonas sp.]|uniref:hypothetical protein n=1 Tax=Brevundimonas sp. TaxID=1871086 RepID=UPI0040344EBB